MAVSPALPPGPFHVIYADPPWSYREFSDAKHGAAVSAYATMQQQDICDMPVGEVAAEDCALLVWGTWPKLAEALHVIEAWGFEYVTCAFVWRKTYRDGTPYCGLGFYTRSGTEFCLLAKRGSVPVAVHDVLQVIEAPVGRHSEKPAAVLEAIDRLWPEGKRLELFARRRWPGWEAWGNQVEDAMPLFAAKETDA